MKESLTRGTTISHYRILSQLGAGGMGEVYLAQDTSELERTVAIKLLPAEVASNQQRMQRFVQEARTVSALNHPNILTIYEFGQADAVRFIATEYVDGVTLREHMSSRRMKLHEVLDVAMQVAGALDAAHEAKVVHRDIKPENIMIRRRDHIVKVLDFGLAKLTMPPSAQIDTQAPTRFKSDPGTVVGTANYMSPEQVRALEVDPRADIWSLGVVLYELVAGRLPFEGATTGDVIAAIIEREPPALARFAPVPHQLERIVTKALAKDRDERYQTVKDLLIDLKALRRELEFAAELDRTVAPDLRTTTGETRPSDRYQAAGTAPQSGPHTAAVGQVSTASSAEYLVREIRSHKRGAIAVLGIFVVAFMTAAYFLFLPRRAGAIDSIAVLPLVNASGDANADYLSDGISESLINNLTQVPKLRVLARSTVFRYKGKEVDPQKVGRELGVRAVLTGRVQQRGDNLVIQADLIDVDNGSELWGEQYNRSISDLLAVQQDIAREITAKLRLKLSGAEEKQLVSRDSSNTEAYQLYLKGRYYWNKRTGDDLKKSIEYFQQAIEKDSRYALAYAALADAYNVIGVYTRPQIPPKDTFPKAKEAALKALELDDSLAEAHVALAYEKAHFEWDWPGAEKEFKRAIELNPNYANAHYFYAVSYLWPMGRLDDAVAEFKRALEIEPMSLIMNTNLGWNYYFLRQYDRAIQQYQKTLEIDPNFRTARRRLIEAYEQKEMYEQALAEAEKVVDPREAEGLARFVAVKAAFKQSGAKGYWQTLLDQNKEWAKKEYVPPSFIAEHAVRVGDTNQAFEWIEKALAARDEWLTYIKIDPHFDSLRSDPRYPDVLRRLGLPQ